MANQKYIIRCDRAGVFFAEIAERRGDEADLVSARRIWSWRGATECCQISQDGVGAGSQITKRVPALTVLGIIEVHPCSEKATKVLESHPEWAL